MIPDLGEIPSEVPVTFVYLLSKAKVYLEKGPDRYRADDFFAMPPKDWPEELLSVVQNGMEQICNFRGYSLNDPFTGLGIGGFYALLATLHFEREIQFLREMSDATIMDEMHMTHRVIGNRIVLYNVVSKPIVE